MDIDEKVWQKFWPLSVPRKFVIEKPLSEYIREACHKYSDRIAVDFYGVEMSYQELNETIDRCAQGLLKLGVQKGERVALHMQNCPQFIICYFGILRAGGVVVCVNPMFKHAEIEHELLDSGAETYVGLDHLYPEVEKIKNKVSLKRIILASLSDYRPINPILTLPSEALAEKLFFQETIDLKQMIDDASVLPVCEIKEIHEDLALLQYTGGTTGTPKGAMITHHALAIASVGAGYWFENTEKDIYLGVTPFFHIMGMVQMMCAPLISGGKVIILTRFTPEVVAKAIQETKCTAWVGATTMLIALLQIQDIQKYQLNSLRYVCTGGSPLTPEIQKKIKAIFPQTLIADGYGLTESVSQGGAITPLGNFKTGFVGVPHINDIKIMDLVDRDKELQPNQDGEIVIKGPALATGYWKKSDETKKDFRNGWFYTGDIGSIDQDGYLKYSGRNKEIIKCSGYSVFPPDVEDLLLKHPAVAEVAVTGIPDAYRGESPKAYIVLDPKHSHKITEKDIINWCKENMAAYKRPKEVSFVEHLPKNAAGKILRRML